MLKRDGAMVRGTYTIVLALAPAVSSEMVTGI
jgi:hypothetical protein